MLGEAILRRYALSRSGLAVGSAAIVVATAGVSGVWIIMILVASAVSAGAVLWLKGRRAKTQAVICGDVLLPVLLVPVTGGSSSPFLLLFYMAVIFTGATLGPHTAVAAAGVATFAFVATLIAGPIFSGQSPGSVDSLIAGAIHHPAAIIQLCVAIGFLFLAALLSGYLGQSFRRRGRQLMRTRRELARSRAAVDMIVDSVSRGLISVNGEGWITRINETACRLLSLPESRTDRDANRLFSGELRPFAEHLNDIIFGRVRTGETVVERAGNGQRLAISTVPIRDGVRIVGAIGIIRDVTESTMNTVQARRQERLATIGAHSAGIVHELRNLLKPLSGAVELLEQDLETDLERQPILQLIRDECDALESFLGELLKFSSDRPVDVQSFSVGDLLSRVAALACRHSDAKDAQIRIECAVDSPGRGDQEALERMLYNLVLNCVQTAPEIEVTVSAGETSSGDLILAVSDNGPGVEPENREKIFEPFFTTRRSGTGLGLAAVRRTAEQHGGTISVSAVDGGGARFEVRLPQSGSPAVKAAA